MRLPFPPCFAPLAVLALAAAPALSQGLTPTHTYETPLGFDPFTGQVIFATMVAPPAGETIYSTELMITWTTDGTQPASLFSAGMSVPLDTGKSAKWEFVGADYGWGSQVGTHAAIASTDLFNGTLVGGPFGFPPTLDLALEAYGGGGLWGTIGQGSKLVFHLGPRIKADVTSVSLSAGGSQQLALNAGPTVGPGLFYLVAGSASGTSLGLDVNGVHVPLDYDAYSQLSLSAANGPMFSGTAGFLDAQGLGSASLNVPAGTNPGLVGLTLHHSMLVADPVTGQLLSASAPVALDLVP